MFLRVLAFAGLLIFFMDLQKRTEQKLVKNSRFVFLVDTSQSMTVEDERTSRDRKLSRSAAVSRLLADSNWIDSFRDQHDVSLLRFESRWASHSK